MADLPRDVPGWAVNLFVRMGKIETKMNILAFLGGVSASALVTILVVLITGAKVV